MMEYTKDWIYKTDSAISSFDLGEVNLKRMDGLPFYTFEEDGNTVNKIDETMCGGNCFAFL